jgi:hypothetical protein
VENRDSFTKQQQLLEQVPLPVVQVQQPQPTIVFASSSPVMAIPVSTAYVSQQQPQLALLPTTTVVQQQPQIVYTNSMAPPPSYPDDQLPPPPPPDYHS